MPLANGFATVNSGRAEVGGLMPKLFMLIAASMLAAPTSAFAVPAPSLYPVLSSDSGGWTWYLRKDTLRTATTSGDQLHRFYMVGENKGSTRARQAVARVKLSCVSKQFVQLRLVSRDGSGAVISETTSGDHRSYWKPIRSGTPTDGAHKLLCAQLPAPAHVLTRSQKR